MRHPLRGSQMAERDVHCEIRLGEGLARLARADEHAERVGTPHERRKDGRTRSERLKDFDERRVHVRIGEQERLLARDHGARMPERDVDLHVTLGGTEIDRRDEHLGLLVRRDHETAAGILLVFAGVEIPRLSMGLPVTEEPR